MDFRIPRDGLTEPDDAEQVWWEVIERPFLELETPYERDPRFDSLTPGQRALYALYWTRSEVDNGGFSQYLFNSAGGLANDALAGAELIGAGDFAELLRELRSLLPGGRFVEDREERIAFLEGLREDDATRLDRLDKRFYDLMGYEGGWVEQSHLARRCAAHVEAHPDDFFR